MKNLTEDDVNKLIHACYLASEWCKASADSCGYNEKSRNIAINEAKKKGDMDTVKWIEEMHESYKNDLKYVKIYLKLEKKMIKFKKEMKNNEK